MIDTGVNLRIRRYIDNIVRRFVDRDDNGDKRHSHYFFVSIFISASYCSILLSTEKRLAFAGPLF